MVEGGYFSAAIYIKEYFYRVLWHWIIMYTLQVIFTKDVFCQSRVLVGQGAPVCRCHVYSALAWFGLWFDFYGHNSHKIRRMFSASLNCDLSVAFHMHMLKVIITACQPQPPHAVRPPALTWSLSISDHGGGTTTVLAFGW